jgi:hypothetical protein
MAVPGSKTTFTIWVGPCLFHVDPTKLAATTKESSFIDPSPKNRQFPLSFIQSSCNENEPTIKLMQENGPHLIQSNFHGLSLAWPSLRSPNQACPNNQSEPLH